MIKTIYNSIDYLLKTNLKGIKYIGLYRNQFKVQTERPILFPAVLVEINGNNFNQQGQGVLHGDIQFTLHVAVEANIAIERGEKLLDAGLTHLSLIDEIKDAIHRHDYYEIPTEITDPHVKLGTFTFDSFETISDFYDLYITNLTFKVPLAMREKNPNTDTAILQTIPVTTYNYL